MYNSFIIIFVVLITIKIKMVMLESKQKLPLGFLSKGGYPTINAVNMFIVYLRNGGSIIDTKVNKEGLDAVRHHFNFFEEGSFEMMIHWGLNKSCHNSETSRERNIAMTQAKHLAFQLIELTR
jgi:hypothetical protein